MAATPPFRSLAEDPSPTHVNATPPRSTPSVPFPGELIALPELSPPPPPPVSVTPRLSSPPPVMPPLRTPASPPPPSPFIDNDPVLVPEHPTLPPPRAPSPSSSQLLPSPSHPPPPRPPTPHKQSHKAPASSPNLTSPANDVSSMLSKNLPLTIGLTATSVALLMLVIFGLVFWICTLKKKNKQPTTASYPKDHPPPLPLALHARAGTESLAEFYYEELCSF